MVEAHSVLETAGSVLDLGVAAVVSFESPGVALPVGDESAIAVISEERQLGSGRGFSRRTMSRTGAASGSCWKGV